MSITRVRFRQKVVHGNTINPMVGVITDTTVSRDGMVKCIPKYTHIVATSLVPSSLWGQDKLHDILNWDAGDAWSSTVHPN